jgi:hypothetical protein
MMYKACGDSGEAYCQHFQLRVQLRSLDQLIDFLLNILLYNKVVQILKEVP